MYIFRSLQPKGLLYPFGSTFEKQRVSIAHFKIVHLSLVCTLPLRHTKVDLTSGHPLKIFEMNLFQIKNIETLQAQRNQELDIFQQRMKMRQYRKMKTQFSRDLHPYFQECKQSCTCQSLQYKKQLMNFMILVNSLDLSQSNRLKMY